jgi:hypothetical protein
MLPHLRHRDDGGSAGPVETVKREPDEGEDYGTLDAVADDLLAALEKKDRARVKAALQSLVDHIQSADIAQDEAMP